MSLHEKLSNLAIHEIFGSLAAPRFLRYDPLEIGSIEKLKPQDIAIISDIIRDKQKIYQQEVDSLHKRLVSVRRHPSYSERPLEDAIASDVITKHSDVNRFLLGNIKAEIVDYLWEDKDTRALIKDPGSFLYNEASQSDDKFSLNAYLYPEGLSWLENEMKNTKSTYPYLVASQVRYKHPSNALHKAGRRQIKILSKWAVKDPRKLSDDMKHQLFEESLIYDFGGITLFVAGEQPKHLDTIVRQRTLEPLRFDLRLQPYIITNWQRVKNTYENPSKIEKELRLALHPTLDLAKELNVKGSATPLELKATDIRNYAILESGPRRHTIFDLERRHQERLDSGQYIPYQKGEEKFLVALEKIAD